MGAGIGVAELAELADRLERGGYRWLLRGSERAPSKVAVLRTWVEKSTVMGNELDGRNDSSLSIRVRVGVGLRRKSQSDVKGRCVLSRRKKQSASAYLGVTQKPRGPRTQANGDSRSVAKGEGVQTRGERREDDRDNEMAEEKERVRMRVKVRG